MATDRYEIIDEALRVLASEHVEMPHAAAIERSVLATFDARAKRGRWLPALWLAAAASLAVFALRVDMRPAPVPEEAFVAIPYTVPPAPYERTSVMRMDIPVAGLLAAGFRFPALDAGSTVTADVLMGQDGRIVALRLVNN